MCLCVDMQCISSWGVCLYREDGSPAKAINFYLGNRENECAISNAMCLCVPHGNCKEKIMISLVNRWIMFSDSQMHRTNTCECIDIRNGRQQLAVGTMLFLGRSCHSFSTSGYMFARKLMDGRFSVSVHTECLWHQRERATRAPAQLQTSSFMV